MSITNPAVPVPAGRLSGAWLRRYLSWLLVGLAVVAVAVVVSMIVVDDGVTPITRVDSPTLSEFDTGRESMTAIQHRARAEAGAQPGSASAGRQSITALDHEAGTNG
jgi:hypothetical protein